ncbi:unnamed protein product [Hydatigera taeniaeformis]|uniref:Cadherin domain-containing protein n=1 Tax=Hydatigena taeniaeformis TaxID=6205 RepID=A0A0R3XAV2_HYDTA|nr:unnamed protein product [Hydatigera taeniaeformis]
MLFLYVVFSLSAMIMAEKLTPILPGDAYSVVGDIEKRQLGRCTYLYAWLAIPQGSHQDIYAHYSACSRLELRFIEAARETRSPQSDFKVNVVEELNRVNKDYTAQLIDLETLDALLQTVKVSNGIQTSPSLTTKDRIFYLADRLGQYTMLAMLRPGRLPKIEIVPPPSEKTYILPQSVLCYRKTCESVVKSVTSTAPLSSSDATNSTMEYRVLLAEAKQENRRLYIQLIIYRVVFALSAFLCVLLAIMTLVLCFRNQKSGSKSPKKLPRMEASYHSAPPYNSLNSASKMTSPVIYSDSVTYPNNTALVLGDSGSLQNTAISSNMSGCELLTANGLNGTPCTHFSYQPLYTADGSGGIKPIPQNRLYGSGAQSFFPLMTAFDRSASPASEGYRTGSLDRRSDVASEKLRRRTPIQLIALPQGAEAPPTTNYIALTQPISQYPQPTFKAPQSIENVQTMTSQGSGGTVIRKLPSDMNFRASINAESASSGVAMS